MYAIRLKLKKIFGIGIIGILIFLAVIIISNNDMNNSFLPLYDYKVKFHGLPGSYLKTKTPNGNFCNFRFGLPEELLYEDSDLLYPLQEKARSPYRVLGNVIESTKDPDYPGVTYATHSTADFINYLAEIAR